MKARMRDHAPGALALIEEVFQTAKTLPLSAWAVYFGGTLPLVIGFLYFWADMANHAFAHERLVLGATGISVLFLVAKVAQVLFAHQVRTQIGNDVEAPRPRLAGVVMNQIIVQSTGLFLLPLAIFLVVPFGWLYAVYQNATALDDGRVPVGELIRDARKQAGFNPRQSNLMLWLICPLGVPLAAVFFLIVLPIMRVFTPVWTDSIQSLYSGLLTILLIPLCPFAVVVAINIGAALMMGPQLLKMVLGIDTLFSISPDGAANPTFFIIVSGLTYLCLDPLVKIAYTLRCFHGDSVRSGKDLRLRLERIVQRGAVALAFAACLLGAGAGQAQRTQAEDAAQLDRAIDTTLHDARFAWRMPRERPEVAENGAIASIMRGLRDAGEWLRAKTEAFSEWVRKFFERSDRDRRSPGAPAAEVLRVASLVLVAALLSVLGYLAWKTYRRAPAVEVYATAVRAAAPDLEDEGTTADALASAEWLKLAAELLAKGDLRLAMRAYFFAGLARLGQLHLIRIAAYKSNREYARELRRLEHARGELVAKFDANVRVFESVWYGDHAIAEERLRDYVRAMEGISACE